MEPFSSVHDRPRDALLHTLHQRELAQKDQKIQRLQHANNESLKRQWEAQQRGNALAQSLGFRDVFEAQMAIDVAGQEVSYRECLERVVRLEEEIGDVRRVNEGLRERVRVSEGEKSEKLDELQAENKALLERIDALEADQVRRDDETRATATTISRLEQELKQLQDRYDSLLDVKERAAERYKLDYERWKKVKEWIFDEGKQPEENKENEDLEDVSEEEKKKRFKKNIRMKKRMLVEIEEGRVPSPSPFSKPPPLGGIENKENQTPPRPKPAQSSQSPARRIPSLRNKLLEAVINPKPPSSSPNLFNEGFILRSLPSKVQEPSISRNEGFDPPSSPSPLDASPRSSPTVVGTASKPLRNKLLESVVQTKAPLSSPTVPNPSSSSRKPLVFESVAVVRPRSTSTPVMQEVVIGSSPFPLTTQQQDVAASSQTEEDSQVVDDELAPALIVPPPSPPQRGPTTPLIPTSPAPILSSETEPDSQSQMFSLPFFDPTPCPARPSKASFVQSQIQAAPYFPAKPAFPRDRRVVSSRDEDSLRARKVRRVDDQDDQTDESELAISELISMTAAGKEKEGKGKEREREKERKGKVKEVDSDVDVDAPSSTPANPPSTAQKRIEDYSAYKGRGRYGKNANAPKDTINAQFEIDPTRNGGFDYQYDEVVRGKKDRKRMEAGDCECCRDYYEAVGPLPKRLQAPLWRSPPSTPAAKSHFCPRHGSGSGSGSGSTSKSKSKSKSQNTNIHSSGSKRQHEKENEITSHRQAISRHRHHWERPKTPPGYWNIGFPDTQETEEINEMAREMHRRKREEVEREVERGGKGGKGREGKWRRRV